MEEYNIRKGGGRGRSGRGAYDQSFVQRDRDLSLSEERDGGSERVEGG